MSIIKKLFKAGNVSTQIDGSGHKRGKIKLVAIAKDEAFYFPEWVHHHLYFGFDEIDIYINRTTDNSVEVLDSISSIYPQVSWFSADWIDKCPQDAKKQIQFIVYNKVWDEALREGGYSHIFFLDIDEFWIPKSFDLTIHQFLDNYSQSDVISFEWLNDLGDLNAFSELPINIKGNLSPLVKTLYPIDTPIVELRHHVGLLESNAKHILVDGALFKPRQSLIQAVHEDLQSLKAAFIYHRAHRSIEEYISLLYRGRPGETFPYKTNRHGLPTPDSWYQEVALPEDAYFQYTASLNRFKEEIDFSNISKAAKQFVLTRFNESMANLKEYVAQDYPVMMQMFRGVFHHEVVSVFSQQRARMVEESPSDFRLIRDLAIDAASQSIDEAITLMEKAHTLNPTGPLINKKLDEFKRIATSQQAKQFVEILTIMNVILHVGPGKTGSSAIQKWLNEHSDTLLSESVFYPEHSLDENGVSSGNALSIFEYDSKGQLHFSESKAKFLLENARAKQCHTLLLSSEAFIARFEPVLHFFDRCKVIFYLRNPVECAESLYNQSVKRHYNCSTIQVPSEVSFSRLLKLSQTIKNKKDGQLSVRLYGARFFNGGNIIRDFTSTIGLTANMDGYDKQINGSYSFPALEFKRWFNLVPISAVHHRLDRFLQQYCGKTEQFSLYTKKQYEEFKALSINALEDLFKNIGVEGDKQFLEEVKQSSQAPVFEQGLGKECLTDLVQKIKSEDKHLYSELSQIALSPAHPDLRDGVIGKAFSGVRNPLGRKLRPVSLSFRKKLTVTDCFSSVPVSVVSKEHLQWIRDKLKLANNIDDGILLRDFALFHEELGNIDMAYYFMREARRYRPHGVIILGKLKEYSDSLYSKQMQAKCLIGMAFRRSNTSWAQRQYVFRFCKLLLTVQVLFKKKQANLIVSLTTYSSRIHTVHHTINSLLKQELLPKKIILWLDEKEFTSDTIPDTLKAISSSIFEICYCANLRSYKKLIPTLEKYPNETIITVDDDFEYPATLVADLCKYSNFYPGHVVAARGRIINRVDNSVAPYPSWTFISQEHALSGEHCLIPIGYGGVLYPAGCFDNKITDEDEFMSLAPNADDLWFKAMSWLNGTPVVVIPISCSIKMKTIDGTQESALYLTHNAGDANTEQMKALINRFPALGHKLNSPDFYDCKSNIKFLLGQQQLIALGKEAKDKVVDIRNAALFLEQQQPGLAMQLLFLASKLKPEGAFIKEKLAALRSRLSK